MAKVTIDGMEIVVEEGTTILEAARMLDIDIPTLCYMEGLPIDSSCRMCLVDVEGWDWSTTACDTVVYDGMVVETETERVVNYRKQLLRLYLDNHPNDCLTCQQAGECELQDLSYRYDVKFRDHDGARRDFNQAKFSDTSSPYILRDESKCILCGRCVRTCKKVDRDVLTIAERGFTAHIAADTNQTLEESTCVSCNRCVAACPVGALVDRRAQHKGRRWKVESELVDCRRCEYGCEFEVLKENGKAYAVRAIGAEGDKRPLCLVGRLTTELENLDDPDIPYRKVETEDGRKFVSVDWKDALDLDEVIDKLIAMEEGKATNQVEDKLLYAEEGPASEKEREIVRDK